MRTTTRAPIDWDTLCIRLCPDLTRPAYDYEVDLEQCCTAQEMLDWIFQVAGKHWGHEVMGDFVESLNSAVQEHFGFSVQGVLCHHDLKLDWAKRQAVKVQR